jgi:hypothetical protein
MPNYNKAQTYKLVSPNHKLAYYGSTTQTLKERFKRHKSASNCTSREIIDAGNASIHRIEWFTCCNKHELEDFEAILIKNDWDGCVTQTDKCPCCVSVASGQEKATLNDIKKARPANESSNHSANNKSDLQCKKKTNQSNK